MSIRNMYNFTTDQEISRGAGRDQSIMHLEEFELISLAELGLKGQLKLTEFLSFALQVTEIMGQLHQQEQVYKYLNPAHILLNPSTGEVKLVLTPVVSGIDLSSSTAFDIKELTNSMLSLQTLCYISPEQTGRLNRVMDYRTDFYSLGVTFYELLTGQLPSHLELKGDDVLGLVHGHIAKQPVPPHQLKPDIPLVLSDIVLKLMAKNPTTRYQSAYGLRADLQRCLEESQAGRQIERFPLGQRDSSGRLELPATFYGRKEEIKALQAAFARVNRLHRSQLVLVSGDAGIGKSTLVQEYCQSIHKGYFISGKFDTLKDQAGGALGIPYTAFIQAFRALMRQLLTESAPGVWREAILDALGPNGQVITSVIPEVKLIIGPQPDVPELDPEETQNRFNFVFQNFIKVFTQPSHPLVIFLDDLQWADNASLNLLERLRSPTTAQDLLVIGAYRQNEVNDAHLLTATLNKIEQPTADAGAGAIGGTTRHILLPSLDLPAITQLIADTLKMPPAEIKELAQVVDDKTDGHPFFVREFLRALYRKKLITFDYQLMAWQWDDDQIRRQPITDNLVTIMVERVKNLPAKTQEMLRVAACIGNSFDLETIAIVSNRSQKEASAEASRGTEGEISSDLWPALRENLLLPLRESERVESKSAALKFAHDQVRQAVYSLIPEAEKQTYHWRIGQQLLQAEPEAPERNKGIFQIVNHLNQGRALITRQAERDELAKLNLLACQRAKETVAYDSAFGYGQRGLALLADNCWQSSYQLALSLYTEVAESAYLSGQFDHSTALIEVVLQEAIPILDRVSAYEVRIQAFLAQNQLSKAIQIGLEVLALLGVNLPKQPSKTVVMLRSQQTKAALAEQPISNLIDLPKMSTPLNLAAMRILNRVFAPAYLAMPQLMRLIVLEMVNLSLTEGNAPQSAFAYANYGLILCGEMGEIEKGYGFGELALTLLERSKSKMNQVRTLVNVNFFVRPWREHIRETLQPFLSAYQLGLETGDLTFGTYALHNYGLHSYFSGDHLAQVKEKMTIYSEQLKQERILTMNKLYRQVITNLIEGGTSELAGPLYDKAQQLAKHEQANDKSSLCILHFNQMILSYLFEQHAQAVRYGEIAQTHLTALTGSVLVAIFYFYHSLALLAIYPNRAASEQAQLLATVKANQEKIKRWAYHAPMNYQHKFDLVEAEYHRVVGNHREARDYYEEAIDLAAQHGYTQEEALARELTGKFYLATKRDELAGFYLQKAHQSYLAWGALAKVKALEEQYPKLLTDVTSRHVRLSSTKPLAENQMSSLIDLKSILRASQGILGEIVLEKLLSTLMTIVIENAGAQRGYLILAQEIERGRGFAKKGAAPMLGWVIAATGMVKASSKEAFGGEGTNGGSIITALPSQPLNKSHDLSAGIVHYVAHTKEPVVLHDAAHLNVGYPNAYDSYISQKQPKSILCMPLINQGKLNGILYLENNLITGAFTPDRLQILNLLSSQAAISLENALLYNTLEEKVEERTQQLASANQEITVLNEMLQEENLRMRAELNVTERLQKMMLPTPEELAQIEGLDIALYIEPADEVGGDYIDVLQHDGHVKIGIGDVTGHGLESGLLMLQTQMGVRTLLNSQERDAKRFLAVLNRSIYDNVQRVNPYRNLTLCLLDYTRRECGGSLKVSGQHEEVIVVRQDGQIELVDTIDLGLPLGVDKQISEFVDSLIIELEPGDGVVLYTDGITEAKNSAGGQYGQERLCQLISKQWEGEAKRVQEAVLADLYQHIGSEKINDDITLLVAKQK